MSSFAKSIVHFEKHGHSSMADRANLVLSRYFVISSEVSNFPSPQPAPSIQNAYFSGQKALRDVNLNASSPCGTVARLLFLRRNR